MKIIHRDDIETGVINSNSHESVWYVGKETTEGSMQYIDAYESSMTGINPVFVKLDRTWQRVLKLLDYETSGKKILDLGCGASGGNTESKYFEYLYRPWLGRFLHATRDKTGIEYVGVDVGDLSSEPFRGIQMNLLEENCLIDTFAEHEFDLVIAEMLFNSPELEKQITSLEVKKDTSHESALKLRANLLPQIERIIKPEGVFFWQGGDKGLF